MTPYQQKIQRRRTLASIGVALLLHLLLVGAYLLYEFFFVEDLTEFSGPVLVKLGEPEGEDIPVLPDPEIPETVPEEPVDPVPPAPEETVEPSEANPSPVPEQTPSEEGQLTPVDQTERVETSESVEKPEDAPAAEEHPVRPQPEVPEEPQPVIIKGEEGGNSYEYQFAAEEGLVRRSLSAEIYLFMPLPREVSSDIYDRMTGDSYRTGLSRQALFRQSYMNLNGTWVYDSEPFPGDITALWDYLIKAGYDYKNADYKSSGTLRDVVISFTLSESADLLKAEIQQSSGDLRVDNAVLEGFQVAVFSNASGKEIKGRFTYRFH